MFQYSLVRAEGNRSIFGSLAILTRRPHADVDVRDRQQRFDIFNGTRLRQLGKQPLEIRVRLDAVGLGRLDQAVILW